MAALLLAVTAAPASALSGSAPRVGSPYVDQRDHSCVPKRGGGCLIGAVVKYWHKKGAVQRSVGWVYASRAATAGAARWLYKAPGRGWKVGGGWKEAANRGSFVEAHWGRGGHTGRKVPRGTQVCVEFKGLTKKACIKMK
ncbi:hypothetical protein [Streptomyces sp. NPDC001268]|uniref:hypothetical protein n=1 Tax=Streptomyces sp. NPDC001268 TaxID=3364553 RepID=UPI0036B00ED5